MGPRSPALSGCRSLGLSVDITRKLAELPEVPIYKPSGTSRHFATRAELNAWLRQKT